MTDAVYGANAAQAQRWNGESGRYWTANRERHSEEQRQLIPHLLAAADISPGEHVLDVGCGCGETTVAAARAAEGGKSRLGGFALGLDLSEPMLEVAIQLAVQSGVRNVRFVQGDAQTCPLRRASCDVMISSFGVMFFEDPAAAFTRIADVMRSDGRLAFLCWQHDSCNELLAIPLRTFSAHMQLSDSTVSDLFLDPQRIIALLSGNNWKNITIDAVTEPARIGSDVPDVMNYVRGMPVIRNLVTNLDDKILARRVFAAIADEYAARQKHDGVWVHAAAWLVTAHRA